MLHSAADDRPDTHDPSPRCPTTPPERPVGPRLLPGHLGRLAAPGQHGRRAPLRRRLPRRGRREPGRDLRRPDRGLRRAVRGIRQAQAAVRRQARRHAAGRGRDPRALRIRGQGSVQRLHVPRRVPARARLALGRVHRDRRRDGRQEHSRTPTTWRPARSSPTPASWWSWRRWPTPRPRRPACSRATSSWRWTARASTAPPCRTQVGKVRGEPGTKVTLTVAARRADLRPDDHAGQDRPARSHEQDARRQDRLHRAARLQPARAPTSSARRFGALLDDGAVSIVFDLRDNPGGYIDAAQKIASEFIGSGLIFSQESSGGEKKRWEATGDGLATDPKSAAGGPRQRRQRIGLGDRGGGAQGDAAAA